MKTIFISYGRDEQNPHHVQLVKQVKSDLEQEGYTVLMDIERLKVGDDWQHKLESDIAISDWILFFITPYSARRPDGYCLNELSYALYKQKTIMPIMLDFIEPPLSICRIQYLDLQKLKDDNLYKDKVQTIIDVLSDNVELGFEGGHTTLLTSLEPLRFESVIAKHIYGFVGRQWIYEVVDNWLENEKESRVLCITAKAGYGKSALAIYLSESHPSSTSIHFCQHDSKATRDPKNILKTLIYELSTQIPHYYEILQGLNIKEKLKGSAVDVFRELLEEPLKKIDTPVRDLFFIIDGIDEAKDADGKNPLVDMIASRFSDFPEWLNIIITSRPEPELMRKLKKFKPLELKANVEDNINDLKLFIAEKLDTKLDDKIINTLISKSEGNMLYLKMMIDHDAIKKGRITLKDIEGLPEGMEDFYQQYFERKFKDVEYYEEKLLSFVSILVAAQEGISVELIKYVLEINERTYNKILESFGSLLEISHNKLSFYHKSLFDWLSDYDKSGNYSADIDEGNHLLAERLWELYEQEDNELPLNYEAYLLQALFATKSYKKLEIVLKDILFIGRMYNHHTEEIYKSILSSSIKKYSKKCDLESLKIYESFFREKDHLITIIDDETWRPIQSLFQLAYEDGENSPLSTKADELLEDDKINFLWLKNKNRPKKLLRSGVLKVMKAHNGSVNDVLELSNGNLLSCSDDKTLRVWNSEGVMKEVLEIHTKKIIGMKELSTGDIVSFSKDNMLFLWSSSYIYKETFKNNNSLLLSSFRANMADVLSFYDTKSIRLWHNQDTFCDSVEESILLDRGLVLSYHSNDKSLRLFSTDNEYNKLLEGHTDSIVGALELNNANILSYSKDKTLILWDPNGKLLCKMEGHTNSVEGVLELKNGNILSYSSDETLRLWNTKGSLISVMEGHVNYINGVIELSNGDIVSYSSDETLRLWSAQGVFKTLFVGHTHWVNGVIELRDGSVLSYSWDETLILWSSEGEFITSLKSHTSIINGVVELQNGNLLSYSEDNTLILWDREGILQTTGEASISSIKSAIELDNENVLSCSMDKTLDIWDTDGKSIVKLKGHSGSIHNAIELPNANIVSYSWDKTLRLWNSSGELLSILEGHEHLVNMALGLKNGNIVSYAENETTLRLWDAEGSMIKILEGHKNVINGVIELSGDKILTYSIDGSLMIWNSAGKLLKKLTEDSANVKGVLELDNKNILAYFHDKDLILWDQEGKLLEVMKGHSDLLNGVLKLKNGNLLSYSMDNMQRLWDKSGKFIKLLEGHTGSVLGAIELQNGNILSYSKDQTLIIYNAKGELQNTIKSEMKNVEGVIELNNGNILSYSGDSILRVWSPHGKVLYKINIFSKFVRPKHVEKLGSTFSVVGNDNNLYFYELKYARERIDFAELTETKVKYYND